MASSKSYLTADTRVFWDPEDFPLPFGGSLSSLSETIRKALSKETYRGNVSIRAYCPPITSCEDDRFRAANIIVAHDSTDKRRRLNKMLIDMVIWAQSHYPSEDDDGHQIIVMVIAKDIPEPESNFFDVLQRLDDKFYNVILVIPEREPITNAACPPEKLLGLSLHVWRWETLFFGGPPVDSDDPAEFEFSHYFKCPNTDSLFSQGSPSDHFAAAYESLPTPRNFFDDDDDFDAATAESYPRPILLSDDYVVDAATAATAESLPCPIAVAASESLDCPSLWSDYYDADTAVASESLPIPGLDYDDDDATAESLPCPIAVAASESLHCPSLWSDYYDAETALPSESLPIPGLPIDYDDDAVAVSESLPCVKRPNTDTESEESSKGVKRPNTDTESGESSKGVKRQKLA